MASYISKDLDHTIILVLIYNIKFVAMATRIYRFTYNLPESFERVKVAIQSLEDYYPLDVSMCAMGSNGVRYLSNKITVHRFDPRALRAALLYSIQNPIEIWAMDAAAYGDNSGVQTTEVVLDVVERRRPTKTGLACQKAPQENFIGTSPHAQREKLVFSVTKFLKI